MTDDRFAAFARQVMEDAAPTLAMPAGTDLAGYSASLLQRFANPALHHRTWQIAMDGSQKLPQRLLATIAGAAAARSADRYACARGGGLDALRHRKGRTGTARSTCAIHLRRSLQRLPRPPARSRNGLRRPCWKSIPSSARWEPIHACAAPSPGRSQNFMRWVRAGSCRNFDLHRSSLNAAPPPSPRSRRAPLSRPDAPPAPAPSPDNAHRKSRDRPGRDS